MYTVDKSDYKNTTKVRYFKMNVVDIKKG